MKKVPEKTRSEWAYLLQGKINVPLKNFFFQMKVTQVRSLLEKGQLTIDEAIDDVYNLCVKFQNAKNMASDLEKIFGNVENHIIQNEKQENKPINGSNVVSQHNSFEENHSSQLGAKTVKEISEEKLKEKMDEIARQKREMELKIIQLKKAKEEAERKAKLERRKRLIEMEKNRHSFTEDEVEDVTPNSFVDPNEEIEQNNKGTKTVDEVLEEIHIEEKRKKKAGFFRNLFGL